MKQFGAVALKLVETPTTFTLEEASPPPAALPDNYLTVPGWYARYEPDVFLMNSAPFNSLAAEAEELIGFCERRGYEWTEVAPSKVAQRFGFKYSRAFPICVLNEFFATRC